MSQTSPFSNICLTAAPRYENISRLIEQMERTFESQGSVEIFSSSLFTLIYCYSYLWISDGSILSLQKGIFRINCIDCLDRTNVVEVGSISCIQHHGLHWSFSPPLHDTCCKDNLELLHCSLIPMQDAQKAT